MNPNCRGLDDLGRCKAGLCPGENGVTRCGLCDRVLGVPSEPLSRDCGGDCWGCVGEMEALAGYAPSIKAVCGEIEAGVRPPVPGLECNTQEPD